MKKIMVILLATVTLSMANKAEAQVYGGISFNTFYNELSPYGRWVDDLQYGQVWIADEQGFEPYYNNGRWVYTSYGWTWASDYAWGWAPFHYGRWTYLQHWGWAWVPGYEWGPAWVGWCQNDGYYGWAPLSPGMGFNFSYNSVPNNYWRFVEQRYIMGPSIRNHIIRPERNRSQFRNVTIINNTQVNNNITYVAGPKRESVERITRQKIATRPVAFTGTDERTRVEQKEVRIYRPDLKPNQGATINNHPADLRKDGIQQDRQLVNGAPNNTAVKPLPNGSAVPVSTVQPTVKQAVEQPINRENDRIKPLPAAPQPDNQTAMDEPAVTRLPNERDVMKQPVQKNNDQKTVPQNAQRQDELRLQRTQQQQMEEQQIRAQQEQQQKTMQQQNEQQRQNELKQQSAQQQEQLRQQQVQEQRIQQQRAMQQQNEQRQNEARQQQVMEQREQQQRNLQQQNQQRQNEMRQQQLQEQRAQQQRMMQQQNQQRQSEIRQQKIQDAPVRQQRQTPMSPKTPSRKPNEN